MERRESVKSTEPLEPVGSVLLHPLVSNLVESKEREQLSKRGNGNISRSVQGVGIRGQGLSFKVIPVISTFMRDPTAPVQQPIHVQEKPIAVIKAYMRGPKSESGSSYTASPNTSIHVIDLDEPTDTYGEGVSQEKCDELFNSVSNNGHIMTGLDEHPSSCIRAQGKLNSTSPQPDSMEVFHLQENETHSRKECSIYCLDSQDVIGEHDKSKTPFKSPGHMNAECDACGQTFSKMGNLRNHMIQRCKQINVNRLRRCISQWDIKSEVNVTKKYKCLCCGKHYSTNSNLRKHQKKHTCGHKHAAFICPICCLSFTRDIYLKRHMAEHTSNIYECQACGKSFHLHSSLSSHKSECPAASSYGKARLRERRSTEARPQEKTRDNASYGNKEDSTTGNGRNTRATFKKDWPQSRKKRLGRPRKV